MFRRSVLLHLLASVCLAATAQPVATLVPTQSEIVFTTRQMGVPVEGRFGRFSAMVALDPKLPARGKVSITIDTTSARFGAPELDAEVGHSVWLATAKFAQAQFQSVTIQATGAGRFDVTGRLTIKGLSQELRVPVQLTQSGPTSTASGNFTVKRLDYKVGEGEWTDTSLLANEVLVRFRLVFTGVPPT